MPFDCVKNVTELDGLVCTISFVSNPTTVKLEAEAEFRLYVVVYGLVEVMTTL